ncbi:MAG: hypothetical protein AAF349_06640 [Cyanobacteria bacterium P01_A01_bin.68]
MNYAIALSLAIKFEIEFIDSFFDSVEKHLLTFMMGLFEFTVIATGVDMVAVSGFNIAGFSGQD